MLFCPWRKEEYLIQGYESHEKHYNTVKAITEEMPNI